MLQNTSVIHVKAVVSESSIIGVVFHGFLFVFNRNISRTLDTKN